MHRRGERLHVGLDQAFVLLDLVEALAHRFALRGAGGLDGEGGEVGGVVRVGHAHGRCDVGGGFHVGVLGHHGLDHAFAHRALLAEEAVGLHEVHLFGGRAGEFGEAATGGAPVRDHRHLPAHALQRLDHLRRGADVADHEQGVGASGLQARELRDHVHVVGFELFHAGGHHALGRHGGLQALFVALAPGVVHQDQAGFGGLEGLLCVGQHAHVHDLVHRRHAERVVGLSPVLGDAGAGGPRAHERHLFLVDQRHDGHGHGRVETTEHHRHLFAVDQFARGDHALGRVGLVVAAHQLQLAAAEQAALGVDLVDGDLHAARDGLHRPGPTGPRAR